MEPEESGYPVHQVIEKVHRWRENCEVIDLPQKNLSKSWHEVGRWCLKIMSATLTELAMPIIVSGLVSGSMFFLISSGLSLIFGVLRFLNLTQATLFALGGYFTVSLVNLLFGSGPKPLYMYIALFFLAGLMVAGVMLVVEFVAFRHIYEREDVFQLFISFGALLIIEDLIRMFWHRPGVQPGTYSLPEPYAALGMSSFFGWPMINYNYLIIGLSLVVALFLWYLLYRTGLGLRIRAMSLDRTMATSLGINPTGLYRIVFFISAFISGFGGAFVLPATAVYTGVGVHLIILALVVVVSGGMGSLKGAFIFSYLIGIIYAGSVRLAPELQLFVIFLLMTLILIFRPYGLWGRVEE